jgi:dipeptidyl aminopeptidase/acylaminoacyl peptidase
MRTRHFFRPLPLIVSLLVLCGLVPLPSRAVAQEAEVGADSAKRPIELPDILDWKRINSATLTKDGRWFAYRLSPNEGDSEVVLRSTVDDTEYRFPVGEAGGGGFGTSSSSVVFSEDSRWLAFTIYPDRETAKRLEEQRKPRRNKVGLVELANGELTEFEDVRAFRFAGEAADWIALHRYAPERQGGNGGGEDRPRGSDLLLHELGNGTQLSIGNVSEYAFDKSGRRLVWLIDTEGKVGNGVQLRDMETGIVRVLESDEAAYRSLNWTEEGDGLAVLKGVDDEDYEEPLYSVVGFKDFGGRGPTKIVYNPHEDPSFPEGMTISPSRTPEWTEPLDAILFGIHEVELKEAAEEEGEEGAGAGEAEGEEEERPERRGAVEEDEEEMPELVIWHWKDSRLQSMQEVQEGRDKEFSYLSLYRVPEGRFIRLADDDVRLATASAKGRWAIGYDDDDYELMGNLDGRRYRDVYAIDMRTGERRVALEGSRWNFGLSPDGGHLLYYQDGHYHSYEMATGRHYNISQNVPTSFINTEDDHNVVDPPIYPIGWSSDGRYVLLYDNWDIWKVAAHGDRGVNLTVNGESEGIRYRRRFVLDRDEEGIDLSKPVYLAPYGEWTKKSGLGRINRGRPGVEMLMWDDAGYGSLSKAEDADTYLFTRDTYEDYPNYHVTDASFRQPRQITDANPQQSEFTWTAGSVLLDYESAHGDRLQAALHLPADYEEGKSYPTVVYIYETMSQTLNRYTTPSANGFNKSAYTSNGYAVLMPDITYQVDDPGMSAVWCVLPALEAAIATGVVDPERVGLQGHSWGGYQTAFLITQTDAFAAAVAGAPLTNMISMYSSIYWNSGSANQPIFESSQGRFSGGYWEVPDAYTRNSPVYFAENVTTPLLLLHNDKDGAVDWNQGIEYFNTLRRLEKPVVMLEYVGENHGLRRPPNQKDYTVRMREFFDHYLKGEPAPDWWTEGVPRLEMEEHLKERAKLVTAGKEEGS